jgi:peptidoglycan/xylan/chitin deacetylase (PgdA/CDA1 family)
MPDELTVLPLTLMYHSVCGSAADPYQITVSPDRFAEHMRWLHRSRLRGVSMRELLNAAQQGSASRLIGLTFDDGYADFSTEVLPVLRRYGFTATVFVVAGNLGGHNDWDAGPAKPLMTADQVRDVARMGAEIGSHGMNHCSLANANPALLASEVTRSRDVLQTLLETTVDGFCYPYGELSDAAVMATREAGYDYAVATFQTARRDRHALPRTYVGQRDGGARLLAKRIRHRLAWGGWL